MDATKTSEARDARRAEWQRVVNEQRASGQTATAFCRERGLPGWKFQYWRKALAPQPPGEAAGGFVRVQMKADGTSDAAVCVVRGLWRVCVNRGFDEPTLRRVLAVVAQA